MPESFARPGQRLRFPATARNREPILAVLRRVLPPGGTVLEAASGSGEHAAYFAAALDGLTWQPSDPDASARASIAAWAEDAPGGRVLPPLALDVGRSDWDAGLGQRLPGLRAVLCINLIHIAPWNVCQGLLRGAARLLPPGGTLYLYGPFRVGGRHTAPSNAAFDASLRERNPAWGVRDLEAVAAEAETRGLALVETVAMPANNLSLILRQPEGPQE